MKILISDKMAPEGVNILKAVKEFEVDCQFGIKPEELRATIKDYDALIIRSGTKVTADILESVSKLKFIGRAGVGVDNVDLSAATKKGIVVMNTPGGNTTSTAEHTMSLILALSRNIPQAYASLKAGKWERSKFTGVELYGKTLGIIGLGRIGSTVARMAKSFNMKIIAFDPFISKDLASKMEVELAELERIIKESDYVTIHTPKSVETKGLIGEKEFSQMKKTVRIINCARGGIVNEQALAQALEKGQIAGCAVDVYEKEPPEPDHPLLKYENCVATPHLGASTSEAQVNVAVEVAQIIRDALLGRGIANAKNFPSVDSESYQVLQPYIDLSERMGKFAGQLITGGITDIKIFYHGSMNDYKVVPVTMSLLYGLLSPVLGEETVNFVNAMDIAKERGIKVQETLSSEEAEFANLINVQIKTDKETFTVWGTLSSNKKPRIVKINNIYVEASPRGHMIFLNNNDRPGIVGAVGTILAQNSINIASITFGRESPGGLVVSVVNVDNDVPESVIEKLKQEKDILFVKLITV